MHHFSKFVALLALSVAIAPATAFAQADPSADAYENAGPRVQERIDEGSSPAQEEDGGPTPVAAAAEEDQGGGGELPFTGLDLALVIGAGALLLGLGVGMRRLTRPSREAI
jgi:hypothetical protein